MSNILTVTERASIELEKIIQSAPSDTVGIIVGVEVTDCVGVIDGVGVIVLLGVELIDDVGLIDGVGVIDGVIELLGVGDG